MARESDTLTTLKDLWDMATPQEQADFARWMIEKAQEQVANLVVITKEHYGN